MELIDLIENFWQLKELYAIFYAFILLFGSITSLTADLSPRISEEMLYNVLHKQSRKT
jgi:hypothetical protein